MKTDKPIKPKPIIESVDEVIGDLLPPSLLGHINEYPESIDHVDAEAEIILQANPRRTGWMLVNLSDYEIYVAFSNRASSTFGFTVDASGALGFCTATDPEEACQAEVWASAEQDDCRIYLYEVVR